MEIWDVLDGDGNPTGELVERGAYMEDNAYHLVVHIWITNGRGEFLISKRTPNKTFPCMWETTGGSVVAGESSLDGAVREVGEELGLRLNPGESRLFRRIMRRGRHDHADVWLFTKDVGIGSVVMQPEEVSDVMWAAKPLILKMIGSGEFIGRSIFSYIDELFDAV